MSGARRRWRRPTGAAARAANPAVRALIVRLYRDQGLSLKLVAARAGFRVHKATVGLVRLVLAEEGVAVRVRTAMTRLPEERRPRPLAEWPAEAGFADEVADTEAGIWARLPRPATLVETASPIAGCGE